MGGGWLDAKEEVEGFVHGRCFPSSEAEFGGRVWLYLDDDVVMRSREGGVFVWVRKGLQFGWQGSMAGDGGKG